MPARPLHEIVAENVRRLRKAYGWTQAQLAEMLEIPQPAVARIERGERGLNSSTIDALADALNQPVAALVTPVEKSTPAA